MEYIEITKEDAMRIVDGARSNCPRRLFVVDSSDSGTSIVYTGDNNDELLVGSGDEYEDVLVDSSEMKSCTWWIGEDEQHCILEARDKDGGYLWSGTILGKPTSKEHICKLIGRDLPAEQDTISYEYKNDTLSARKAVAPIYEYHTEFVSGDNQGKLNSWYSKGWEPMFSSAVYSKEVASTTLVITLRRLKPQDQKGK